MNNYMLQIRFKLALYKVMIRPITLYACEIRATTKRDEQNLTRFERKVL